MKFVPAIQEEYIWANEQRQAFLSYLLSLTPDKSITVPLADLDILLSSLNTEKTYLRTDIKDGSITFSLGPADFTPEYEGLLWVNVPEFNLADYLDSKVVPHG